MAGGLGQRGRRLRLGGDPVGAGDRAQQVDRLAGRERAERHPVRYVGQQREPAGHQVHGRPGAHEERAHLLLVGRVVEDDDVRPGPEQVGVLLAPGGQRGRRGATAQRADGGREGGLGRDRGQPVVEPAQVDLEPAGQAPARDQALRGPPGELGLAAPGQPVDHDDPGAGLDGRDHGRQLGPVDRRLLRRRHRRRRRTDHPGVPPVLGRAAALPPVLGRGGVPAERLHDLRDQVRVEPPAPRAEAVVDGHPADVTLRLGHPAGPAGLGDPLGDPGVRRAAGVGAQLPQPGGEVVQGPGRALVRGRACGCHAVTVPGACAAVRDRPGAFGNVRDRGGPARRCGSLGSHGDRR
ncbi:hypothetical protein GCM10009788_00980 [Nocardioides humi]|uniref:Uncharacterized protein n=1 Tax=Nocardioides humi TaxID=449461 RepID=A0ABN1ZPE5_9ACTN